jgi:Skp family chaperone for outer membrane proteins
MKLSKKSKTRTRISKSGTGKRVQTGLDEIHKRIQSKLDELHTDFRVLETSLKAANQEGSQARKDRIEGFKRKLRDILKTANRVDWEWD